jgi:hypothetical protein
MNWLRRMMAGRYGMDQLSNALLVGCFVFLIAARISRLQFLAVIAVALLVFSYFRILSKNYEARRRENAAFLSVWHPFLRRLQRSKNRRADLKTHRYYKCPGCSLKLRVPKGKGKIKITCPECRKTFIKKT